MTEHTGGTVESGKASALPSLCESVSPIRGWDLCPTRCEKAAGHTGEHCGYPVRDHDPFNYPRRWDDAGNVR